MNYLINSTKQSLCKYQYKRFRWSHWENKNKEIDFLNDLGEAGWEVFHVEPHKEILDQFEFHSKYYLCKRIKNENLCV